MVARRAAPGDRVRVVDRSELAGGGRYSPTRVVRSCGTWGGDDAVCLTCYVQVVDLADEDALRGVAAKGPVFVHFFAPVRARPCVRVCYRARRCVLHWSIFSPILGLLCNMPERTTMVAGGSGAVIARRWSRHGASWTPMQLGI